MVYQLSERVLGGNCYGKRIERECGMELMSGRVV